MLLGNGMWLRVLPICSNGTMMIREYSRGEVWDDKKKWCDELSALYLLYMQWDDDGARSSADWKVCQGQTRRSSNTDSQPPKKHLSNVKLSCVS